MNQIIFKVKKEKSFCSLSSIVSSQGLYKFSKKALIRVPEIIKNTGKGTGAKITSRIFSILISVFVDESAADKNYLKVLGLSNRQRTFKFIKPSFVEKNNFITQYKVMVPKSNGNGIFGETLSNPIVSEPGVISTDTFISIGPVKSKYEANSICKYIKTKFSRAMLGGKKVTQDNPRCTWELVPLQDFTISSDIDWSKSISEIDQQLYKKYNLSVDEINFIETKVQAMD